MPRSKSKGGKFPRRERFLANVNRKSQDIGVAVSTNAGNRPVDNFIKVENGEVTNKVLIVGKTPSGGQKSIVMDEQGLMNCLSATDYKQPKQILIREATKKGYAEATEGDSVNLEQPNSKTRRGRVGHGVAQTLTTSCNQGVVEPFVVASRGRNPGNPGDRTPGIKLEQRLEAKSDGTSNTITSVQKTTT